MINDCFFRFYLDSYVIGKDRACGPHISQGFLTRFLAWGLWVFNLIFMLSEKKIAPEDVMFLKVFKHDLSHVFLWVLNSIHMLSEKIAREDLIFLKVSKPDFSHAVLWALIWFLCYQRRSRLRTSDFSRSLNTIYNS